MVRSKLLMVAAAVVAGVAGDDSTAVADSVDLIEVSSQFTSL
jgi:hypothetical protein